MIEIEKILSEFKRVLKPSGHIIILTMSMEGYKGDWVSLSFDFPENKRQFESGETVKLLIRGTNVILHDYYWTDQDYRDAFTKIHLRLIELHNPIGYDEDKIQWREESQKSPYSIYVLAKT
jgi:ubiquinone/menaquinone biosynthesis C-methylase UbiE